MLAIAETIVLIAGGFDLTIGAVMALSATVFGTLYVQGLPFALIVALALASGVAVGALNAFLVVALRLQPFIVTLATMSIVRSVVYGLLKGNVLSDLPEGFLNLGYVYVLKIPLLFLVVLLVAVLAIVLLRRTVVGRRIFAVGGNERTAFLSGVHVDRTKYLVYSLSGLISAMAGLMYTARIRAVVPDMGITSPLEVITAVLIGGTAITGGKGSVFGSLLGILAMYLLLNGFNLLGLNPFWQTIILGAILIYVVGQENILRGVRAALRPREGRKTGMTEEKRLEGQAALITGAGSGIGRAIAVAFAREGARVGINYCRNEEGAARTLELVRGEGAEGALVRADVSSAQEVAAMVRELETRWQGLEVLVNNSGIGTSASPDRVAEIDEADWDRVLDVNLKGVMLACRAVLPGMMRRGSGAIVNISSIRGLLGNPSLASYCASKGGEVLLTRSLALDYARYGVRVNCICPGFVLSEMLAGYIAKQADPAAAQRAFAAMAPQNRIGRPEEIAAAAVFFASRASSFITGVALPVDGGYTASGARDLL